MSQSQPPTTRAAHTLPFDRLSPRDFERLCLWLVEREGYERAEHLGAAGSEQGRDIIAWREGALWAFQCKRVQRFGPTAALTEVEKVLALPQAERPAELMFLVTCDVSATTRQQARDRCAGKIECYFWASTELDEKVKRHPDIVEEFFQAPALLTATLAIAPAPPAHFVGRQVDLAALAKALTTDDTPQAITGMGGIGKTALARKLVGELVGNFPGGVFWADLTINEGDPLPILAGWARLCAQDVSTLPADPHACAQTVRGFLAERVTKQGRLLVVIDDVRKDWLDEARVLDEARPGIPLLLTTRDKVLALAMNANVYPLCALSSEQAVELLSELAESVVKKEKDAARRLAELVDCLPLAVELAGKLAKLRTHKPDWRLAALCEQVEKGRADKALRLGDQPGLAATFSLSYDVLDDDQRCLFRALGAFAPVPMAAEHMTTALGWGLGATEATGDNLDALVDMSLVRWWEGGGTAGVRYTMHPLLYEFAADLTPEEERKGFRTPVLNGLRESMCNEDMPESERRTVASLLTRLDWWIDIPDIPADEILTYLKLFARYLGFSADRLGLVKTISRVLDMGSVDLHQQAQLLVYRAVMLGQLGESLSEVHLLDAAVGDYEAARGILKGLIGSEDSRPEDYRVVAQVALGAGSTAAVRAEMLSKPDNQDRWRELLQEAANWYLAAVKAARAYGQDVILETCAYKELSYTYALLQNWTEAEEYYSTALEVLERGKEKVEDSEAYVSHYADILETGSNVHEEKGKSLTLKQNSLQALREYERAYELTQKEIAILERDLGESDTLVIAHLNSGLHLLAMSNCPDCTVSQPLVKACQDWQIALAVARRLGLADLEQAANEHLELYCQNRGIRQDERLA